MIDTNLLVSKLSPLNGFRNEWLAALVGFAFGGIGLAIYLRSLRDGLAPIVLTIFWETLSPTNGSGILVGGLLAATWGFLRVHNSNERQAANAAPGTNRP